MNMNRDRTYCKGQGCAIKESCIRYNEGKGIDPSAQGYWWMEQCDVENRTGYKPSHDNPENEQGA